MKKVLGRPWLAKAEEWLGIAGAVCVASMMLVTTADVVMRKLLHSPIPGAYEYVTLIFVTVVFLGLAFGQRTNTHIQIDFFYSRFSSKFRRQIDLLIYILALSIFAVITWQSSKTAFWAWQHGDTMLGAIPVVTWPSRVVIPIGTFVLCLRIVVQIIDWFLGRHEMVKEDNA